MFRDPPRLTKAFPHTTFGQISARICEDATLKLYVTTIRLDWLYFPVSGNCFHKLIGPKPESRDNPNNGHHRITTGSKNWSHKRVPPFSFPCVLPSYQSVYEQFASILSVLAPPPATSRDAHTVVWQSFIEFCN